MKSPDEQLAILRHGVDDIVPEEELREKLIRSIAEDRPLRVKYGIDPTGVDVHLGHTVPLRKLRQFQDLGHQAVIIIGNYTALVGDPSGRDETRARLTPDAVEQNAKDYLIQVAKVVDLDRAEVVHNGDWFGRMSFLKVLNLMSKMTVARLLERDDFDRRMRQEKPIYLHECLYPLMQGWDSVEVRADVELGGTEQLFSLMVARNLQRDQGQEPQVAVTLPILVGTDGVRRMGKSLGNYIGVGDPPDQMFGKIMSLPDNCMRQYFELLTDRSQKEIEGLLGPESHPKQAKIELAKDIVSQYWGSDLATKAAEDFEHVFSQGGLPSTLEGIRVQSRFLDVKNGRVWLPRLLVAANMAASNSDARRLIQQGAVRMGENRELVTDMNTEVSEQLLKSDVGLLISVGKRKIAQVGIVRGQ